MSAALRVHTWRGEAAITLAAGAYTTTFLPECGLLGVSLTHDGDELLALPRSIADYRRGMPRGGYTGLPLNAPYANRLATHRYTAFGREARVSRRAATDLNSLPIHGTLEGQAFAVGSVATEGDVATLRASFRHDDPVLLETFPFEHRYDVTVELSARGLAITTSVTSCERAPVPVSFGWHPFFRVPGALRGRWSLRLPPRRHARLDDHLLPTGTWRREPAEDRPLARRTFDDHYTLDRDRRFSLCGADRRIDVRFDRGYPFAQIYVPAAGAAGWLTTDFVCIEPMTAPINALLDGVAPTTPHTAVFRVAAHRPRTAAGVTNVD